MFKRKRQQRQPSQAASSAAATDGTAHTSGTPKRLCATPHAQQHKTPTLMQQACLSAARAAAVPSTAYTPAAAAVRSTSAAEAVAGAVAANMISHGCAASTDAEQPIQFGTPGPTGVTSTPAAVQIHAAQAAVPATGTAGAAQVQTVPAAAETPAALLQQLPAECSGSERLQCLCELACQQELDRLSAGLDQMCR